MATGEAALVRLALAVAVVGLLAACGSPSDSAASNDPGPSAPLSPSVTPPKPPFTLDCAPGENIGSGNYDHYGMDPTFDMPQGVADRVLAAHPTWQVVAEDARDRVDVAVYNEAGEVKGILLAQRREGGWYLSADSHCYDTDPYR
jgi:hypothetical protein